MRVLNQHAKSCKPRDGAEYQIFWFWRLADGTMAHWVDDRYQVFVTCWADEMRCLNLILSNLDLSSDAAVAVAICQEDGSVKAFTERTVLAGSYVVLFNGKNALFLEKNEYITVLSDNINVSVAVNGYYLSGYDWFHIRQSAATNQVEHALPGGIKHSALKAQAEGRRLPSLRADALAAQAEGASVSNLLLAQAGAQAEYARDQVRNAWSGAQVEWRDREVRNAATMIQVEHTI